MSLLNPGKRGIYTLVSVLLIIGIPGIIAYADGSSDTYYSASDVSEPSEVSIKDSNWYSFGFTAVENDDGYTVILDSVASDEETNLTDLAASEYKIKLSDFNGSATPVKVQFTTDIDITFGYFRIFDGDYHNFYFSYNDEEGVWEVELDSVDVATIGIIQHAEFIVTPSSTTPVSQFDCSYAFFEKTTIFTEDVVELLVLIGGIALLVLGTMALSFFDVTTPGKAFRSAGRSIKNVSRRK